MLALAPVRVQAALDAWDDWAKREDERHRSLRRALEKARYEAERMQRQYDAVEPENRLVAAELEQRWEGALIEVKKLEEHLHGLATEEAPGDAERHRLLELGDDLETLWSHPTAPREIKKRILRTVLEEIVAEVHDEPARTELILHWKGGVHTRLTIGLNKRGRHGRATDQKVVDLVRELAKVCEDFEIARILNRLGYRTGAGNSWIEGRVRSLRSHQSIPVCRPRADRSWCTLADAASVLGVSATAVRRLLRDGVLDGQQVITHAPWVISKEQLALPAVQAAAQAIREGRPAPSIDTNQTQIPFDSTT